MLVDGCKAMVVRCRLCGRLVKHDLNLFSLSRYGQGEFRCKCGDTSVIIGKADKNYRIRIKCFNCGDMHIVRLGLREIIRENYISCSYYNSKLCFIGDKGRANQIVLENEMDMACNEGAIEDSQYFYNFQIFGRALKQLYFLNSGEKINCDCGKSEIHIDLFPDRLELKCNNCGSVKIIFAETEEDLSILMKRDKITLREHNISCIDSIRDSREIKE